MILPLLISLFIWMPIQGFYMEFKLPDALFKKSDMFKPNEFQALNIKLDYGNSPEPYRLSRKEKLALKLTQITKTIAN